MVSAYGEKCGVIFDNDVKQIKQEFDLVLRNVYYEVDKSELLYFKVEDRIQCAGHLKMAVSP
jgi:hypothetical protein